MSTNQNFKLVIAATLVVTLSSRLDAQGPTAHAATGHGSSDVHALMLDNTTDDFLSSMSGAAGGSPITLNVKASGTGTPFGQWMAATVNGTAVKKNGSVITAQSNLQPVSGLDFSDATLSEITFPALDAGAKDAYIIAAIVQPTSSSFTTFPSNTAKLSPTRAHPLFAQDFRVTLKGLEGSAQYVSRVDAITLRLGGVCPGLTVTVGGSHAAPLIQAQQASHGERGDTQRWSGSVEILEHGTTTAAYRLQFTALRLVKLVESFGSPFFGAPQQDMYTAQFACEKVELK
jgi:hypothetical protein